MARKMKIPGWPEALTPQIPGIPGIPGLPNPLDNPLTNTLTGGFDFVKNLWGGLPATVPGFVVPTVDIEELDKRIKDLKAVEAWLEVNGHMLRATIQSLEVQRNTVAAIKAIGGSLGGTAADLFRNLPSAAPQAAAQAAAQTAASNPFAVPAYAYPAAPDTEPDPQPEEEPAPKTARAAATKPAAGDPAAPGLSATAWLGFLQDQFNNVALAALAGSDAAAGKPTSRTTTKAVSKAAVSKAAASKRAKSAAKTARKR